MSRRAAQRASATAAVLAALLLAGCQGDDDPDAEGPTPTAPATSTSPGTTETPTDETSDDTEEPTGSFPPWRSDPSDQPPADAGAGQEITDVRTGRHDGFDRVVLDLTGDEVALGWFARLVDEPAEAASGRPVEVEGERFLELGIAGIDWTTEAPERYDGSTVTGQGTEVVTEVVHGVLFEGQQQIFVGLRQDTEYRVFALDEPARIVIDVRHA